jgi:LytR cell envelope-related transcriptional attenuator
MGSMLFAFSVHNFISSVGADAGFAAIIGLAVLVLLYFAHARETANLREEAAILTERLQQAEIKVAQLSRPQPAAVPVAPPPMGAQTPAASATADRGEAPFAPAGVGAPALAAATHVVPISRAPSPSSSVAPAPQPAMATAGASPVPVGVASAAPAAAVAAASGATAANASRATASPATVPPPSPSGSAVGASTAQDGGDAAPAQAPGGSGVPAPATAAGANGSGQRPPSAAPVAAGQLSSPPRGPVRPGATGVVGPLPPLRDRSPRRSGLGRRIALAVAVLVVVAVAVALVTLTATSNTSSSPPVPTTNAPSASRSRSAAFVPSSVTVAVLNGTATNQLAHRVSARLAADGYRQGRIATASDQTETTTVVGYLPGARNRSDALHVATALKLRPASVRPIDQGTQQVACPPPSACTANVVVTVGADLATL